MSNTGQQIAVGIGTLAGAAIGSIIPGAGTLAGARIGFMAGALLGSALFPSVSKVSQTETPNTSGLQITQSSYGVPIPIVIGARKIGGNIIYYGNFKTISHVTESGGKGGGGTTSSSTSYTYTCSLAVGLCMGPADVLNVWVGSDLVSPANYIIYDGTQTTPDPHMQACKVAEGKTRFPVWKNLCYVVFPNFDLGSSTNVPNFTFEVVSSIVYSLLPIMASNTSPFNEASASTGVAIAYKAFDKDLSTCWETPNAAGVGPHDLDYIFDEAKICIKYTITATEDSFPIAWNFLASVDGSSWATLDTQAAQSFTVGQSKTYTFANTATYHHHRLKVSSYNPKGEWTEDDWANLFLTKDISVAAEYGIETYKELLTLMQSGGYLYVLYKEYDQEGTPYAVAVYHRLYKYDLNGQYVSDVGINRIAKPNTGNTSITNCCNSTYLYRFCNKDQNGAENYNISAYSLLTGAYSFEATLGGTGAPWTTGYGMVATDNFLYFLTMWDATKVAFLWILNASTFALINQITLTGYYPSYAGAGANHIMTANDSYAFLTLATTDGGKHTKLIQVDHAGNVTVLKTAVDDFPAGGVLNPANISNIIFAVDWNSVAARNEPVRYNINTDQYSFGGVSFAHISGQNGLACIDQGTLIYGTDTNNILYGYKSANILQIAELDLLTVDNMDVSPTEVSKYILTDALNGCGLDETLYLNATKYNETKAYCIANDLLVSMIFDRQSSILDILQSIIAHHNGYITYYNGKISHNQLKAETAEKNYTDNDLVHEQSELPMVITKKGSREISNKVVVEYTNRENSYATGTAKDSSALDIRKAGLKIKTVKLDGLTYLIRAQKMAGVLLRRSLFNSQEFDFGLGPKSASLKPGSVISYTNATLSMASTLIRLLSISEAEDYKITVKAIEEEINYDIPIPNTDTLSYPIIPNLGAAAGSVSNIVFVEIAPKYTDGACKLIITSSKPDQDQWCGVDLYRSYSSGGVFQSLKIANYSGVTGTIIGTGTMATDSLKYIDILLSYDYTLSSATDLDELLVSSNTNLCIAQGSYGDIYFRFQDADLIADKTWRLSNLIYDCPGFAKLNDYGSMATADVFALYFQPQFSLDIANTDKYKTLYYKLASYNFRATEQSLANISEFSKAIAALCDIPLSPCNATINGIGVQESNSIVVNTGQIDLTFVSRNRKSTSFDTHNVNIPEDSDFSEFQIIITKSDDTVLRTINQATKTYSYTTALQTTDGGPFSTYKFKIYQKNVSILSLAYVIVINLV